MRLSDWPDSTRGRRAILVLLTVLAGVLLAPVSWWQDKPFVIVLSTLLPLLIHPPFRGEG